MECSILLLEYCLYNVTWDRRAQTPGPDFRARRDIRQRRVHENNISGALPVLFTLAPSPPISYEHQHDLANINESTTGPLSTLHPPSDFTGAQVACKLDRSVHICGIGLYCKSSSERWTCASVSLPPEEICVCSSEVSVAKGYITCLKN